MPFLRKPLTELRQQALNDLMTAPGGDGMGLLRFAVSKPLSLAIANLANDHYGYLDWIARQATPFRATDEYLEAWGSLVGITRKPAVAYAGIGQWTGGTVIPSGTPLAAASGFSYTTTADATLGGGGTVSAPFLANLAGTASTLQPGDQLALSVGVAGVNSAGVVLSTTSAGVDDELDDPFRSRILGRWAAPPQGGSLVDYLQWALAVPGVTRAWVAPLAAGTGTVSVYTMWDAAEAAHAGFPQGANGVAAGESRGVAATGDQLTVANAILPLQPVTALVYSQAPVAYPVNFTIADLDAPTVAVKAAIALALAAAFLQNAAPAGTVWPVSVPGVVNGQMYPSQFETAIAAVAGVNRFTLTAPSAKLTAPAGSIPTLGSITYI